MVTRAQMAEKAMEHDTLVALAFRRALGIGETWRPQVRYGDGHRYRHMRECFRNAGGVDPDAGRY